MKRNFVIDEEISLSENNDILKTQIYANNLYDIITSTPNNKVFTIGVFGGWGTGKSSIIKTVRERMESNRVKFITYDAWKYANDSFRRMFLLKVQEELKFDQTEEMQRFYQSESIETEPQTYISKQGLWILILVLLIILVIINSVSIIPDGWKVSISSIFTLIGLLITVFNGVFQKLQVQISKPHLFAPEQFESCFKIMVTAAFSRDNCPKKFGKYIKLIPNSITGIEKLIIVIDNIDRCHNEMAYQLLTDIKTFLSDEKINVVFIIPVDDEALKQILFFNQTKDYDCYTWNEEFLRKFFNVTVRIKPHQATELNTYAKTLNKKYNLGFNDNTLALCSKEFATSPRRIIQLFNNLTSELGLYPEDFASKNESLICIVLILKEEYPYFYKNIVKNVNKLTNYNFDDNQETPLSSFMRIVAPITRNVDISDLLYILTNSDAVFDEIPSNIKREIRSYAVDKTIDYIKTKPEHHDIVFTLIKRNIQEDIKSHSRIQIINSIEFISSISRSIKFPKTLLMEIDVLLKPLYRTYLLEIDKSKLLDFCQFALTLESNSFQELKMIILAHIISLDLENAITEIDECYIKAVLTTFNTMEDSATYYSTITNLFKKNGIYKDINYSQEQKNSLFNKDLILYYIERITIGENRETEELLWLLKNSVNIDNECYSILIGKLNNIIGATTNKPKEQVLSIANYITKFFNIIPNFFASNIRLLNDINNKIYQRNLKGYMTYILIEYKDDHTNLQLLINLFIHIYRISNGVITQEQASKMIALDKAFTYSRLLDLSKQQFDLKPFWESILSDNSYENNSNLISLVEFCILQQDKNGILRIEERKIQNKIKSLCDNISISEVLSLIERLSENEKIKILITSYIATKDSNYINNLPQSILIFALNSFNQENCSQFENNTDFLCIIASNGSDEQKTEIVKLMTERINKRHSLNDTFKVLENIQLSNRDNKNMLLSALRLYKKSVPNDSKADSLILKFEE